MSRLTVPQNVPLYAPPLLSFGIYIGRKSRHGAFRGRSPRCSPQQPLPPRSSRPVESGVQQRRSRRAQRTGGRLQGREESAAASGRRSERRGEAQVCITTVFLSRLPPSRKRASHSCAWEKGLAPHPPGSSSCSSSSFEACRPA